MKFEEFRKHDTMNFFMNFISVKEAKESGLIPKEFAEYVPDTCDCCKSDYMISLNRTILRCCNPLCVNKLAKRMSKMFSNFEVDGVGDETCILLTKICIDRGYFKVPTYTEIFRVVKEQDLSAFLGQRWFIIVNACNRIMSTRMSFAEMVSKLAIPTMDKTCFQYFGNINNTEHLVKELSEKGVMGYLGQFGVASVDKGYNLKENLKTISNFEYNMSVPLILPSLMDRKICITGSISVDGYRLSRKEFLELLRLESMIDGNPIIHFHESKAFDSLDYVIADGPSSSSKYQEGASRGIIITAQEYLDNLRKEMGEWKKKLEEMKTK